MSQRRSGHPKMRIAALAVAAVLASCGGPGDSSSTTDTSASSVDSTAPGEGTYSISWKTCAEDFAEGDQCGTIEVPYDYENPSLGRFTLHMRRHPARVPNERIGTLLVNPGGPGFGGQFLAQSTSSYFSSDLTDRFDIIGWDPRGTGESEPHVDCFDNYDQYVTFDPTPDNDAEKQEIIDISKKVASACESKSGEILPWISTNNSARDMNAIRIALKEDRISYFGFSYGSELGATWATMFPETVRVAVLDGATDPTADAVQGGLLQAAGFEKEFNAFLDQCAADKTCPFHNGGKPGEAFDALVEKVDADPVVVSKNRTPVNQSVLYTAVSQALYSSSMWPELEDALAALQKGDGSGALALYDNYYQRKDDGTYGNELEAFVAIGCLDDPGPATVEESDKWIPAFLDAAPRLGMSFAAGYGCVFWPAKTDHRIAITGKGAGPIVVVGTTGDSATPLVGTRKMAETLEDGRLVVVDAQRHTGYGVNDCVTSAVDQYLITTKVTFKEKAC